MSRKLFCSMSHNHICRVGIAICAFVIASALFPGCATGLRKEKVIAIARQEFLRNPRWKDCGVRYAKKDAGRWSVLVYAIPETPGGHAFIEMSEDGKVLQFQPGL